MNQIDDARLHTLLGRSLLTTHDWSTTDLDTLLAVASRLEELDRAGTRVDVLRGELDEAAVHERTGCVIHTSYWPAKLRWLAETQPQLGRDGARWVGFGEYLLAHFTGSLACSVAMASGTGMAGPMLKVASWISQARCTSQRRLTPTRCGAVAASC